jgi:hypothetical protein
MSDSDYEVRLKTTGRNDHCPCGSGKKYKKCHSAEDEGTHNAALKALHAEAIAKTKASKDTEGEVDAKGADESTRAKKRKQRQPESKGRAADGQPKNMRRRAAV